MGKTEVDRWLRAYVDAWKSYDPDQIGELFTEDVKYRYHPYDDPVEGRDAVGRCREFTEWYIQRPGR